MGNDSNFTSAPPFSSFDEYWIKVNAALEIANIFVLVIASWLLLCLITYGTKTGRWRRRPRTSSLNDGMIYVSCTLCVVLFSLQIAANHVLYILPRHPNGLDNWCEMVCDLANGAFYAAYCASYCFLWFRQRLIYTNPFVIEKLQKWVNWFSRVLVIILIASWTAVACVSLIPRSYSNNSYGCIEGKEKQDTDEVVRDMILVICTTIVMSILSLYPAVSVKFDAIQSSDADGSEDSGSPASCFQSFSSFCQNLFVMVIGKDKSVSPIHLSVRRTVLSSFIMAISVVATVVLAEFALPQNAPNTVLWFVYNINSLIFIFCMIGTFGFASHILFLPCTLIPRKRHSLSPRAKQRELPGASV